MVKNIVFRVIAGVILLAAIGWDCFLCVPGWRDPWSGSKYPGSCWWSDCLSLPVLCNAIWLFLVVPRVWDLCLFDSNLLVLPGFWSYAHPDMGTPQGLAAHAQWNHGKWTLGEGCPSDV